MRVIDHTGYVALADQNELLRFVAQDLLSSIRDQTWLDVIRIKDDGPSGDLGYWTATFQYQGNDIIGMMAVIVLNHFYLKTISQMKEVLAHEYGHHWTLSYYAANHDLDIWNHRLSKKYYDLRGLSRTQYAHDYSKGWNICDKEVMAEDYRVLFSPAPFNQNHRISNPVPAGTAQHIQDLQF